MNPDLTIAQIKILKHIMSCEDAGKYCDDATIARELVMDPVDVARDLSYLRSIDLIDNKQPVKH